MFRHQLVDAADSKPSFALVVHQGVHLIYPDAMWLEKPNSFMANLFDHDYEHFQISGNLSHLGETTFQTSGEHNQREFRLRLLYVGLFYFVVLVCVLALSNLPLEFTLANRKEDDKLFLVDREFCSVV